MSSDKKSVLFHLLIDVVAKATGYKYTMSQMETYKESLHIALNLCPEEWERYDWYKLKPREWFGLLAYCGHPAITKYCNWKKMKMLGAHKSLVILLEYPEKFATYCSWKKFKEEHWAILLTRMPKIIDDNEEAQHLAVNYGATNYKHINRPFESTTDLYIMLYEL